MLAMSSFAAIRGATYRNQHVGNLFFFKCRSKCDKLSQYAREKKNNNDADELFQRNS
jgi:hypothetical protein